MSCKTCWYYNNVGWWNLWQDCSNATRRLPSRFGILGKFMLKDSMGWLLLSNHKNSRCKFYKPREPIKCLCCESIEDITNHICKKCNNKYMSMMAKCMIAMWGKENRGDGWE